MRGAGRRGERNLRGRETETTFPKGPFGGPRPVAGLRNIIVQENKDNSSEGENEFYRGKEDFRPSDGLKRHLHIFTPSHVSGRGPGTTLPKLEPAFFTFHTPPWSVCPETGLFTPSWRLFSRLRDSERWPYPPPPTLAPKSPSMAGHTDGWTATGC